MATALHSARTRFFDKCGKPLCGGTVHTYQVGTTTDKPTYTDVNKTATNTNPVILDSIGSAAIFLDGAYRVRVLDRNGVLVEDIAYIESWISATEQDKIYENIAGNKSAINAHINAHINKSDNPHKVTKAQVGLGNVDNTADIDKPVSDAAKAYIDQQDALKADSATTYSKSEVDTKVNAVSGGYIGAVATLSELQAKTGMATGQVAKVMNDPIATNNGDYRYNGTAWVKGYDALTDAKTYTDNAIELTKNSNLIFTAKLIDAYIDHTSGKTYPDNDIYTTDFIALNPQKHYTINQKAVTGFAFFDADKNFVSGNKSIQKQCDFKAPTNTKYIRVSFKKTDINAAYLYAIDDVIEQRHGIDLFKSQKFATGIYVNQDNGGNAVAEWTSVSEYLPILSDRYYRINQTNYTQYAFYDERLNYIADTQSANSIKVFKTPNNAKYLRITVNNTDMSSSYLKLLNPNYAGLEVTVGSGVADFNKIQDAIVFANAQNKWHTIKIAAGTYVEELQAISETLAHSFIGASKEQTIITDGGNDFEMLKISGGYFENLTFERKTTGYCVHADYAKEGIIEFFNCNIKTVSGSVLGAGSHQNQTLRLRNCQLYQKGATIGTGIMYWHNNVNANVSGQRLEMFDCDVYGDEYALRIDDANKIYKDGAMPIGNATCLFVKNTFWSTNTQKYVDKRGTPTAAGAIVGNIVLDPRSHGNNIAELNA